MLRAFKFLAVLAAFGVCWASANANAAWLLDPIYGSYSSDYYNGPLVNPWGGGAWLPPAPYIVDAPLGGFDNGYNPTYYWNRPRFTASTAYGPPPCSCAGAPAPVGYGKRHHPHRHHMPMNQPDRSTPP
jgi:hypothetical protein